MTRKNLGAAILIVIASALWGAMPVPLKMAEYDPLWTAWVRFLGNTAIMLFVFRNSLMTFGRPKRIELGIAVCFFGSLLAYTLAMRFTSAANAVIFTSVSPFAGAVAEILMGRRPTWKEVWLMFALLIGVVVLNGGVTALRIGDVLALLSGVLWGGAFPKAQSLKERFQLTVIWQQLLGMLAIPVISVVQRGTLFPPVPSISQFGWLVLLMVLGGVAYVLHTKATQRDAIAPHINLSLQVFQAVTASILGYAVLSEPFGVEKGIGATIIFVAGYLLVKRTTSSA